MRSKFKWIFTLLLAFSMQFSFAQEKTVTGTVTEGGLPLPGVSVVVKGTTRGTQTDMDGNYTIKAKTGEVLVFSFIGMKDAVATVGAGSKVNVAMVTEAKQLENVVIGAVGIKKRADAVTSTNQVVKTKELTQASQPNIIQSLSGKVSGLQVNMASNGANPSSRIVLRGTRSITGNSQALVVIDNAISNAAFLAQLPPEVIESVNIVKGQQGAALYGEQGSNGVIIVTTKKGTTSSKLNVSLNSSVDFQDVLFLPERQDKYGQGWGYSYDFGFPGADPRNGNVQFSPWENGAWGPSFADPKWAGTTVPVGLPQADGSIITGEWKSRGSDNIKDFYKTGTIFQTNLSVNAGDENGYALLNVGRQTSDFIVENDGMKRNTFMFKGGKKLGKFKLDATASYTNQTVTQTDSDLLDELLQTPTNVDINLFRNSGTAHHWTSYAKNPWQIIKQKRFDDKSNAFNGIMRLEYEFNKHISVNYTANAFLNNTVSTSHNDGFNTDYNADYSPYLVSIAGANTSETYSTLSGGANNEASNFYIANSMQRNFYSDLLVNFDYDLTKDVNFKLNLGNNIQDRFSRIATQGGTNLDVAGWYNIKNVLKPDNVATLDNRYVQTRTIAGFANMDLGYKDYLFLNATGRYERSSVIAKSFFYPSVGLSFVPTKAFESIKGKVLNYAKVYANVVKTGNSSAVSPYAVSDVSLVALGFPFGDLAGYRPRWNGVNMDVTPEFVINKEVGASLGFFNDRVTLEGSYYIADTKSLISDATSSRAAGLTTNLSNNGELQNKGFEIDLGLSPFRSENGFNWNFKVGLAKYKTTLTSLEGGAEEINLLNDAARGVGIFAVVGDQFPVIKGTQFQRDAEGRIIVDANGNPLTTSTFGKLGNVTPEYIINFSNTFSYKGISLTAVADYRANYSIYSQTHNRMLAPGYTVESADFDRDNGYVIPNSVTAAGLPNTVPVGNKPNPEGVTNYFGSIPSRLGESSVVDASAIKIRELALSYSLPSKLLKNTGISTFKFGVNARNPFIFFIDNGYGLKNRGYADPESSITGGNGNLAGPATRPFSDAAQGYSNVGQYPTTKTYGVSLNITF